MMASRGMGAIAPSKMPKGKTVERKDNPNKVRAFAEGGGVKTPASIEDEAVNKRVHMQRLKARLKEAMQDATKGKK